MRVVHMGMTMTDGTTSVFDAWITRCQWTNKAEGRWRGKPIKSTGRRETFVRDPEQWHKARVIEREESQRIGIPALHDVFPMYCPICNALCYL